GTAGAPTWWGAGVVLGGAAAVGCVSVSGTGNATNTAGDNSCGVGCAAAGVGVGVGCLAGSGTGNASNTAGADSCGFAQVIPIIVDPSTQAGAGLAVGAGCVAASGTGSASNTAGPNCCGVSAGTIAVP